MIADVPAILGAINSVMSMVKGIVSSTRDIKLKTLLIKVYDQLFMDKTCIDKMADEIKTLENKLDTINNWENEKDDYELIPLGAGNFAYRRRKEPDGGIEHDIHFCSNCFENKIKTVLNFTQFGRELIISCPKCNAKYKIMANRQ